MIRRPPRSTRTDTLFPYTTLFRSVLEELLRELKLTSSEVTTINPFGEIWRIPDEGTAEGDDWQIEQFALAPYLRLVDEFCRESLPGIASKRVGSGIDETDRKSVVKGTSVSGREDLGGRRNLKKK